MSESTMHDVAGTIARMLDTGAAALSALWPRSVAAREVARLVREGHVAGVFHEVLFSTSCEDMAFDRVLRDLQSAGFAIRETNPQRRQCTVAARIPLTAYQLHATTARLERLLARHGGFAAFIGPVRRNPLVIPASVRPPGIESSLAS